MSQDSFNLVGKAFYSSVHTPNSLSGKYQTDLSVDDETALKLKTVGIETKIKIDPATNKADERGQYVTLKSEYAPKVVDSRNNQIPNTVLIGNGSTVEVKTHIYEWKFKTKSGSSLGLDAVQVLDLVTYTSAPTFETKLSGFVIDSDTQNQKSS